MTANPGGGDYRPDEYDREPFVRIAPIPRPCRGCGVGESQSHVDDCPAVIEAMRVAQDAPDAPETPARTLGGSGTAEAHTEAQGEYQCPNADCTREHIFIDVGLSDKMLVEHGEERESGTDPGMTNEHAELVALRAERADWMRVARERMAERDVAEAELAEARAQVARVEGVHVRDGAGCAADGHVWPCPTVRALAGPAPDATEETP